MNILARLAPLVAVIAIHTASASGFTNLFIFGDSLSDVGNAANASFGIFPGRYYFDDRFSNGPVYAELLSQQLGLGAVIASSDNGNNYAFGGATTSEPGGTIVDLDQQVSEFLGPDPVDGEALYIVWAGANDLFEVGTNVADPVANIVAQIQRLYDAGARELLVPNLPKLGLTPAYNAPSTADFWNDRTVAFNTQLKTALDAATTTLDGATLYQFDVEAIFDEVVANPASYNLTNVTDPAALGLDPGDLFYNTNNIVPNPNQYAFWDTVHPTATMHAALADALYEFLQPDVLLGDFNGDGLVTIADYGVWRDHFGAAAEVVINNAGDGLAGVGGGDYAVWKANLGQVATSESGVASRVPEPISGTLFVAAAFLAYLAYRRT